MGDLFLPLFALILVLQGQDPAATWENIGAGPALLGIAVYFVFCWGSTWLAVRRHLREASPEVRFTLPALYGLLHFGAFFFLLAQTDWASLAQLLVFRLPFVDTIVGIAPLFLMHAGRSAITHVTERVRPESRWKRRDYVIFRQRVMALPILPLVALDGVRKLLLEESAFGRYVESYAPLTILFSLVTVLTVFALAPVMIRFVLGARPLPPGPLRERLEAYGRRTGFRPNDILVWNTGGGVTNALYVGIVPRLKYVVITDALIGSLDPEAIEAVYAHEAGHGVKLHTQLYLVLITGFMLLTVGASDEIQSVIAGAATVGAAFGPLGQLLPQLVFLFFSIGFLILFLLFVFGWLSRRFETEADLHAVETLEESGAIGRALEAIGLHMGVLGRRGGMRHFGIGRRLGLINRFRHEIEFREGFVRLLRRCRIGILGFCALGVLLVIFKLPVFIEHGDVVYAQSLYLEARDDWDPYVLREAAERARERLDSDRVHEFASQVALAALSSLADGYLRSGNYEKARGVLTEMREVDPDPEPLGAFNRELLRLEVGLLDDTVRAEEVVALRAALAKLARKVNLVPASLRETYGDLYLMERAVAPTSGAKRELRDWSPEACLLVWWDDGEREGRAIPADLRRRLEDPEATSVFRRELFYRATQVRVSKLLAESERR